MLIYLDMCCLKRPFDGQSQPRIRLESEAVLGLLALESREIRFVRSSALLLENRQNPVITRAARVERWLLDGHLSEPDPDALQVRTAQLMLLEMKNFDALHVASAEQAAADIFVTCDDRLLAIAQRNADAICIRVAAVMDVAKELCA